ncbi:MAG: methionine--tRNA ligase [Candidatus Pacebacteria bacterium]|nr:methionine--tRNA ligase [Candidatus Paceibacterota bacterium]
MKKFYITTSIAYTNAPPHIGFALESVQADVLARYYRKLNHDVFFLTGVDQHGLKIVKKAKDQGLTTQEFVQKTTNKFKKLTKELNLSNDDFIETTDRKRHWPYVQKAWLELINNNDIYKKKYKGFYCVGCEAFLKEKELVDKKCLIHQKELEIIEEENYFFKLSKYAQDVKELIQKDKIKIIPKARKNEILSFINQGVEDISVSRDKKKLSWGIPVPRDDQQIMYVWLDALLNYTSVLNYNGSFEKYWPADIHCLGKDIFRFHALLWPAILLALGLKTPKTIFVHGFITVDHQKMSKSLGNVIDPFELIKKYGTDSLRYYLLREVLPTEDGDFTIDKFESRYNSDLASGLGNLFSRVRKMTESGYVEQKKDLFGLGQKEEKYHLHLKEFKFQEALKVVFEIIKQADVFIDKNRIWEKKNSPELGYLVFVLERLALLLEPFLPQTSEKMRKNITPLFPRIK